MPQYINIHTHHLSTVNEATCVFNNRFDFDKTHYTDSYFSIGIHPWDTELVTLTHVDDLEKMIIHKNCLAIGECGLDKLKGANLELQKKIFDLHLQLAYRHSKPVIIHCVKSFDELIEICHPYQKKVLLMIHGFNKSMDLAKQLVHQGFYLSLGPSSFNKTGVNFSQIPLGKLFLETDNNSTFLIQDVYKMASQHFNIELNELKEKIYTNFETIFYKNGR